MGKTGFWLRGAKGKLAGTTLYQSGGETIQREIVTPKNPRSDSQMRQRVIFAAASKFYSMAQQNRFALAFQNKAANNTDFNAFMKENVKAGLEIYPTKDQVNDPNFPLMNPWIVAKGNLPNVLAHPTDDGIDVVVAGVQFGFDDAYFTSWQEVIDHNQNLGLQWGDIITYTIVLTDSTFANGNIVVGQRPMLWTTRQIIIGADLGNRTINEYCVANGFDGTLFADETGSTESNYVGIDVSDIKKAYLHDESAGFSWMEDAAMIVCTLSRRVNGKLRVSNSSFRCTPVAQQIYTRLGYDSQLREAIDSYKPNESNSLPTEVLEGSVAKNLASIDLLGYAADGRNYVAKSPGATVAMTAGTSVANVVMFDSNPIEGETHGFYVGGTGSDTVKLDIMTWIVSGAGTEKQKTASKIRISSWGSTATTVQLRHAHYDAGPILTLTKPA